MSPSVRVLKYVGLLLARFNLATLARAEAGDAGWQDVLNDPDHDAEVEAWVAAQVSTPRAALGSQTALCGRSRCDAAAERRSP
jgi:hypothetical protein